MNARSRNKNLIFIIIFLLLINIASWIYIVYCNKKPVPDKGPDGFVGALKRDVGFDTTQIAAFNALKKTHWAQARADMDTMRQVKIRFFDLTKSDSVPDSIIQQKTDSIALLQKRVEISSFNHFKATRKLCRPEQLPAFDSLIRKIINRPRQPRSK